jgi:hypothetical protein
MNDYVDSPDHYKAGEYECCKVMQEVFGNVAFRSFCLLNAFKYLWRQGKKGPITEDVQKAKKYLELAPDTWDARELLESYNAAVTQTIAIDRQLGNLQADLTAANFQVQALQENNLWAETRIKQLTEQVVELKRSLRKKSRKGKTNG